MCLHYSQLRNRNCLFPVISRERPGNQSSCGRMCLSPITCLQFQREGAEHNIAGWLGPSGPEDCPDSRTCAASEKESVMCPVFLSHQKATWVSAQKVSEKKVQTSPGTSSYMEASLGCAYGFHVAYRLRDFKTSGSQCMDGHLVKKSSLRYNC